MIRTAKFLLIDPPKQELRTTMRAFTNALQYVADQITQAQRQHTNNNNQDTDVPRLVGLRPNLTAIRKALYQTLRTQFSLPSQMAQTAPKLALAAVKTVWKTTGKAKHNTAPQNSVTVRFTRPHAMFQYNRDYSLLQRKDGLYASLRTLHGRVRCRVSGGGFLEQRYLQGGWRAKAARLYENTRNERFYLLVSFEKDAPKPTLERLLPGEQVTVLGVDRGLRAVAAVRTVHAVSPRGTGPWQVEYGGVMLFRGGVLREKRRQYVRVRARLQSRGTRSAKKLLRTLRGREKRFFVAASRQIAKSIMEQALKHHNPVIALEDLTGITRKTVRKQPRKTGSRGRRVSKGLRGKLSSWHHRVLLHAILAKAEEHGVSVVFVDPRYSSQTCPRCFRVSAHNREKNRFTCVGCGYSNNADLSAATIIGVRCLRDLHGSGAGVRIGCPTPRERFWA